MNFCEDCYWYSVEREYCFRYECHAYNTTKCVNWEPKGDTNDTEPPKEKGDKNA